MNVVFIEKKLRTDKLGIMYLAAVLKKEGHEVYLIQDDIESAESYMLTHNVDIVCWSMMTCESEWMINTNKKLKKKFKFVSIVGGPHCTFFSDEMLKDTDIDFIVVGAGELVINSIVNGETTSKVIRGDIPDINNIPYPYRPILYRYDEFGKSKIKRFMGGRYCHFNCNYCFNNQFKKIYKDQLKSLKNRHNVLRLMEEIDIVKEEYGMEHAAFNDDDIAADKKWLVEFCEEIKKRKIEWSALIRASSVDYNLLNLMRSSGCEFLTLAIESANENTQRFLNRGFVTSKHVKDAIEWSRQIGIKTRLNNIIGLPVDDPLEDALETLRFSQDNQPTESIVSVFQPYRGTTLWTYCVENGLIDKNTDGGTYYHGTKLKIKNSSEINNLYHWWPYFVTYKIPMDLVKILLEIPVPIDVQNKLQNYKWEYAKKEFFKI